MAERVETGGPTAAKRGRGRPAGAGNRVKQGADAAAKANAMLTVVGDAMKADPKAPAPSPAGFGHNRAEESAFLRQVQILRKKDEEIKIAKEAVKALNGQRKDLRNVARSEGIVLGELDDAVADLDTERADLQAKEERRRLYREWLGLPTGTQAELELDSRVPVAAREQNKWRAIGNTDGRLGKERKAPDYCPPDRLQDYLAGWEDGQKVLMSESPLTKAAFEKPGARVAKDKAAEPAPEAATPAALLILSRVDFQADGVTDLDDANRKTLIPERLDSWNAAERVVAVFDGKRRILKEPGYEDTGEPDSELTDIEDAAPEEVAQASDDGQAAEGVDGSAPATTTAEARQAADFE